MYCSHCCTSTVFYTDSTNQYYLFNCISCNGNLHYCNVVNFCLLCACMCSHYVYVNVILCVDLVAWVQVFLQTSVDIVQSIIHVICWLFWLMPILKKFICFTVKTAVTVTPHSLTSQRLCLVSLSSSEDGQLAQMTWYFLQQRSLF